MGVKHSFCLREENSWVFEEREWGGGWGCWWCCKECGCL